MLMPNGTHRRGAYEYPPSGMRHPEDSRLRAAPAIQVGDDHYRRAAGAIVISTRSWNWGEQQSLGS
jgi:hypothetical protein